MYQRALVVDGMSAPARERDHDGNGERVTHERRLGTRSATANEVDDGASKREDDEDVDRDRPDVKDREPENPGEEQK